VVGRAALRRVTARPIPASGTPAARLPVTAGGALAFVRAGVFEPGGVMTTEVTPATFTARNAHYPQSHRLATFTARSGRLASQHPACHQPHPTVGHDPYGHVRGERFRTGLRADPG